MRLVFVFLTLTFSLVAAPIGPATNSVPIVFSWDDQPGVSNVDWRVYYSTNITTPTNQWPLFSLMTNTVTVGSRIYWTNSIVPGTYFFTATGSNFWSGESFFSVAAATGPSPGVYPSQLQNLSINRAGP